VVFRRDKCGVRRFLKTSRTGAGLFSPHGFIRFHPAFSPAGTGSAIRAEENLCHFILTGKPLDPRLTLGQIIALRYAGDEEFAGLAKRAVGEALTNDEIKREIRNWRADYSQVWGEGGRRAATFFPSLPASWSFPWWQLSENTVILYRW
jgi:hypothetical protein